MFYPKQLISSDADVANNYVSRRNDIGNATLSKFSIALEKDATRFEVENKKLHIRVIGLQEELVMRIEEEHLHEMGGGIKKLQHMDVAALEDAQDEVKGMNLYMLGVGEGRLKAVIYGDIFASPSLDLILAKFRVVTGLIGCLLIVKNYIGDHLSFGLAAEETKSEDYKIETAIIGDDCALPPPRGIVGRRDLVGIILVHKVTGVATSLSVIDITFKAQRASEMGGTLRVALFVCTLPGQAPHCPIDYVDNLPPTKIHVPLLPSRPTKSKESLSQPLQLCEHGLILELANEASIYAVNSKIDGLNDWNSKAGDGDFSSTMYRGATTILDDIKNIILLLLKQ
ncbi:hypothetical protein GQ457_09G023370 [Hibiscus cannabinus]